MWFQNLVAVTHRGKLLSFVAYLGFTCLIADPVFGRAYWFKFKWIFAADFIFDKQSYWLSVVSLK